MLTKRQSKINPSLYTLRGGLTGKDGFTLVELLIVIVVGLIITAGVVSILWIYIFDFEQTDDITAARQRGEMVLSILEGPILHAGLGMPDESPDFADSFNSFSGISAMDEPVIPSEGNASEESYICYSLPSSNVIVDSSDFSAGDSIDITLNSSIDTSKLTTSNNLTSWVTFPTSCIPFKVSSINTSTKEIKINSYSSGSGVIAQYDELHYIRAIKAGVKEVSGKNVFYTEDITMGSGEQPRVDGVEKIYFDHDHGIFSIYILARGNKQGVDLDPNRTIPGWPTAAGYTNVDRSYRLSVTKGSWRIRN